MPSFALRPWIRRAISTSHKLPSAMIAALTDKVTLGPSPAIGDAPSRVN